MAPSKRGAIAADIRLDATTTPYTWTIDAPRDGDTYSPKVKRRNSEERVSEVLGAASVGLNTGDVLRLVNGSDQRRADEAAISMSTVQNTLTKLAKRPGVVTSGGHKDPSGKFIATTWQMTSPEQDT